MADNVLALRDSHSLLICRHELDGKTLNETPVICIVCNEEDLDPATGKCLIFENTYDHVLALKWVHFKCQPLLEKIIGETDYLRIEVEKNDQLFTNRSKFIETYHQSKVKIIKAYSYVYRLGIHCVLQDLYAIPTSSTSGTGLTEKELTIDKEIYNYDQKEKAFRSFFTSCYIDIPDFLVYELDLKKELIIYPYSKGWFQSMHWYEVIQKTNTTTEKEQIAGIRQSCEEAYRKLNFDKEHLVLIIWIYSIPIDTAGLNKWKIVLSLSYTETHIKNIIYPFLCTFCLDDGLSLASDYMTIGRYLQDRGQFIEEGNVFTPPHKYYVQTSIDVKRTKHDELWLHPLEKYKRHCWELRQEILSNLTKRSTEVDDGNGWIHANEIEMQEEKNKVRLLINTQMFHKRKFPNSNGRDYKEEKHFLYHVMAEDGSAIYGFKYNGNPNNTARLKEYLPVFVSSDKDQIATSSWQADLRILGFEMVKLSKCELLTHMTGSSRTSPATSSSSPTPIPNSTKKPTVTPNSVHQNPLARLQNSLPQLPHFPQHLPSLPKLN